MTGQDEIEVKKPLSLWEKVKVGTVGFVKSVISYIPRGLITVGIVLGLGTVAANMGWFDPLALAGRELMDYVPLAARMIGIGSLITGGIGAYQTVRAHDEFRNKEIELQQRALQRARSQQRQLEQNHEYNAGHRPQHDLPSLAGEAGLIMQ